MSLLRRWGHSRESDELSNMELSPSLEAWSVKRIDDQPRDRRHMLMDDGEFGEFGRECWVARIVLFASIRGKRSAVPPLISGVKDTAGGGR